MTDTRLLSEIAEDIKQHWYKVAPAAQLYLDAMFSLKTIGDRIGMDDGRHVVVSFLSNSSTWRGDDARRIKFELRSILEEENIIKRTELALSGKLKGPSTHRRSYRGKRG